MLTVAYAEYHIKAPYAECHYAKCYYAECRDACLCAPFGRLRPYYKLLHHVKSNTLAYLPGASMMKKKVLEYSTLARSFTKDIFMKDSIEAA
jgi:hypothetical protein